MIKLWRSRQVTPRRPILRAAMAVLLLAATSACSDGGSGAANAESSEQARSEAQDSPSPDVSQGGQTDASGDPIRIAAVADQTGALATSLGSGYLGAQAYVDVVNSAGGVAGRQIEFNVLDAASDPDTAQLQFRQALESPPSAILHFGTSGELTASASLLTSDVIPVISVGAPDALVLEEPGPIYMNGPSAPQIVQASLTQIREQLGVDSVEGVSIATLGLETPYTDALLELAHSTFEDEGASIAESIQFPFQVPSFTAQAARVVGADPDAVMLTGTGTEVPTIVGALVDAGFDGPIVAPTPGGQDNPTIIESLGVDTYSAARFFLLPSDSDVVRESAGAEHAGNAYYTNGWASMKIVLDAIERCDCTEPADVDAELESGETFEMSELAYGPVSFTDSNHAGLSAVQFIGLDSNGEAAPVGTPVDIATSE